MPPARIKIEIGMRFGNLTVVAKGSPSNAGHPRWDCQCECGHIGTIRQSHLAAGTAPCKRCAVRQKSASQTTHGMFGTVEYHTWNNMRGRCQNKLDKSYARYGGRGITVCERWQVFENFFADMGLRPSPNLSLDRIDNNKGYSPENCRWATKKEQSNNTSTNTHITFAGYTKTLAEWCRLLGVSYDRVLGRIYRGLSFVDAVTSPKRYHTSRTYPRNCKDCGKAFARGHSAQFCLECVRSHHRHAQRSYRLNQRESAST